MRRERLGNRSDLVRLTNWESEEEEAAEKTQRSLSVVTGMHGYLHPCNLCYILCKITVKEESKKR